MTLNDVRTLILRYFTKFGSFRGALHCVEVVEVTFAISSPDEFLVTHGAASGCVYYVNFVKTKSPDKSSRVE